MHIGGDSLLAAQMLVMVEERTGMTVPMGEMVRARYYQPRGIPLAAVTGAFFVERLLDLVVMILLAVGSTAGHLASVIVAALTARFHQVVVARLREIETMTDDEFFAPTWAPALRNWPPRSAPPYSRGSTI